MAGLLDTLLGRHVDAHASSCAVTLKDVTVAYERHPAVHHVSGRFESGSLTAIFGPNGAGKSTLLKSIVGLLQPASGRIDRSGVSARRIAYLPQQAEIDREFPISVIDTVLLGHWRHIGWTGRVSAEMRDEAAHALEAVGLGGFEQRIVGTLSSGQFQRVLFARMMLQDSPLILLDEPFTAIDSQTTSDLLDLIARWHGEKRTVVAVLHDAEQVRAHFPETLLIARECLGWGKTVEVLTPENLLRARRTSEAWDETAAACHRDAA